MALRLLAERPQLVELLKVYLSALRLIQVVTAATVEQVVTALLAQMVQTALVMVHPSLFYLVSSFQRSGRLAAVPDSVVPMEEAELALLVDTLECVKITLFLEPRLLLVGNSQAPHLLARAASMVRVLQPLMEMTAPMVSMAVVELVEQVVEAQAGAALALLPALKAAMVEMVRTVQSSWSGGNNGLP